MDREDENSEGASSFPSVFCCHTTPGNAQPPKFSGAPKALELFILHCSREPCKDVRFIFLSLQIESTDDYLIVWFCFSVVHASGLILPFLFFFFSFFKYIEKLKEAQKRPV